LAIKFFLFFWILLDPIKRKILVFFFLLIKLNFHFYKKASKRAPDRNNFYVHYYLFYRFKKIWNYQSTRNDMGCSISLRSWKCILNKGIYYSLILRNCVSINPIAPSYINFGRHESTLKNNALMWFYNIVRFLGILILISYILFI
jgi:hypothetical protein